MNIRKITLFLQIIMPIIFAGIGLYCLIFTDKVKLEPQYAKMFGYILIAYGAFRGYRAYKLIKEEK